MPRAAQKYTAKRQRDADDAGYETLTKSLHQDPLIFCSRPLSLVTIPESVLPKLRQSSERLSFAHALQLRSVLTAALWAQDSGAGTVSLAKSVENALVEMPSSYEPGCEDEKEWSLWSRNLKRDAAAYLSSSHDLEDENESSSVIVFKKNAGGFQTDEMSSEDLQGACQLIDGCSKVLKRQTVTCAFKFAFHSPPSTDGRPHIELSVHEDGTVSIAAFSAGSLVEPNVSFKFDAEVSQEALHGLAVINSQLAPTDCSGEFVSKTHLALLEDAWMSRFEDDEASFLIQINSKAGVCIPPLLKTRLSDVLLSDVRLHATIAAQVARRAAYIAAFDSHVVRDLNHIFEALDGVKVAFSNGFVKELEDGPRHKCVLDLHVHKHSAPCVCGVPAIDGKAQGSVIVRISTCGRELKRTNSEQQVQCTEHGVMPSGTTSSVGWPCMCDLTICLLCYHEKRVRYEHQVPLTRREQSIVKQTLQWCFSLKCQLQQCAKANTVRCKRSRESEDLNWKTEFDQMLRSLLDHHRSKLRAYDLELDAHEGVRPQSSRKRREAEERLQQEDADVVRHALTNTYCLKPEANVLHEDPYSRVSCPSKLVGRRVFLRTRIDGPLPSKLRPVSRQDDAGEPAPHIKRHARLLPPTRTF
jgi:hypothetical protein